LEIVIVVIFILYIFLLIGLLIGWERSIQQAHLRVGYQPLVSVIIAVRNEAGNIPRLLDSIKHQTYLNFEVIIVDDHSSDDTLAVISNISDQYLAISMRLKLLRCTTQAGKKAALTMGIKKAMGEIIVTTDADCTMHSQWLQLMVNQFSVDTMLVVGSVRISTHNFFSKLQQLEFASLIGSGAASLGWNVPSMCNGANLAFKKIAFEKVGGYLGNDNIASGDDEFLLHKIHHTYPRSVAFNATMYSVVETKPLQTLNEFVQQRLRWAGKWRLHRGAFSKVLAVSIFLFQSTFLLLPWLVLSGNINWQLFVVLMFSKALFEYFFFRSVVQKLGITFSWLTFLTLQFIYPYYVVAIALLSNFTGYKWKDRQH
jgi:poly-beta-1,6-N-acetyl-D-glucosamine synthase